MQKIIFFSHLSSLKQYQQLQYVFTYLIHFPSNDYNRKIASSSLILTLCCHSADLLLSSIVLGVLDKV